MWRIGIDDYDKMMLLDNFANYNLGRNSMKRKIILITAMLVLALLTGCGKAEESQTSIKDVTSEKITEEQSGGRDLENNNMKEGAAEAFSKEESSGKEYSEKESATEELSEKEQQDTSQSETQKLELQHKEDSETKFSFSDVADRVFYFSSGAGAWCTELVINSDGTFKGNYHDSDMGDGGEAYPNGTLYYCDFLGMFCDLEKVDAYTYKMKLASIVYKNEPEKAEIIDGVRYVYSTAYGLEGGEDYYLYLPGAKLADLPKDYLLWVGYWNLENTTETVLPYYGLYNVTVKNGFSSYEYKELRISERIAKEILFAEERDAALEAELQGANTQAEMSRISKELYQVWDDTLNIIWNMMVSEFDDTTMDGLRTEELNWIAFKEAEVEAAGMEYEGGSIRPMIEFMKAAELTKQRVYELAKYVED